MGMYWDSDDPREDDVAELGLGDWTLIALLLLVVTIAVFL